MKKRLGVIIILAVLFLMPGTVLARDTGWIYCSTEEDALAVEKNGWYFEYKNTSILNCTYYLRYYKDGHYLVGVNRCPAVDKEAFNELFTYYWTYIHNTGSTTVTDDEGSYTNPKGYYSHPVPSLEEEAVYPFNMIGSTLNYYDGEWQYILQKTNVTTYYFDMVATDGSNERHQYSLNKEMSLNDNRLGLFTVNTGFQTLDYDGNKAILYFYEDGTPAGQKNDTKIPVTLGEHQYMFTPAGTVATGWYAIHETAGRDWTYHYFNENGIMQKNCWATFLGGLKCYLLEDGTIAKGWQTIDGEKYYFEELYQLLGSGDKYNLGYVSMATGLKEIDGKIYFFDENGVMQHGWTDADGKRYFDENGVLQSGKQTINGKTYYLSKYGALQTGWYVDEENKVYYLGYDGAVKTGWQVIGDKKYYFDDFMQTGWKKIEGYWYFFNTSGQMQTGELNIDNAVYILNDDGQLVDYKVTEEEEKNGWVTVGEDRYYYIDNVAVTGWQDIREDRYYFNADGIMQTGFVTLSGKTYYLDESGVMQTGWVLVDDKREYFGDDGVRKTGKTVIGGKTYYLNAEGEITVGWVKLGDGKHYFDEDGVMQTGWLTIGSEKYNLNSEGIMRIGLITLNGSRYFFDKTDGHMYNSCWRTEGIAKYYFGSDGKGVNGKQTIGGKKYYFTNGLMEVNKWVDKTYYGSDGVLVTGWKQITGKDPISGANGTYKYYFDSNGKLMTGLQKIGNKTYYLNGYMTTKKWIKLSNKWRYFDANGYMAVGWLTIGKTKYYMNSDGTLVTGWKKLSGKWYFFTTKDGIMQTKWAKISKKWYYFGTDGVMRTGVKKIGGKYYYFYSTGIMAFSEYVKGYWYNKDGIRTGKATGKWKKDKNGWYFKDGKWYAKKQWLWIDDAKYYFNAKGYVVINKTISGKKLNKDGKWVVKGKVQHRSE